ncbi:flavin reductase family protein [Phreatobacter sp. AB_2022a]|uniref:flavin reductase family protein n=1 Tax=Phreatobacter sp. AB_2022a TaxID=3003134 RepID=UPI00056F7786|nr:flavin reductase family protein [Phreatobacter sp. AB_2022a]MCZ0737698.1 flavin reductase family protein [Phreatobacter sp. AB_2022a]
MMESHVFRQAMRHCAGAVALVTVGREAGRRTGLTVTAACSLSDDPPSLLVCVNRKASANPRIRDERSFAVNFLGEQHLALALTFSGQKGVDGDDRFSFGDWTKLTTGTPVLHDAVAAFDCDLGEVIETRTHSVFVGNVRAVSCSAEMSPLVYLRSAFHGIRSMREVFSLGDMEARKLSWADFS